MKTKILFFAVLFITVMSYGQECLGVSFNPPATPSSFTFNYKTVSGITGWYNASDVLTTPPSNSGNINGSVGVFENLTYFFGNFNGYPLYVAPGVTFTGDAVSLKDSNFIFEGKADFVSTPGTGGTKIYIYPDGELTFYNNFSVSSNEFVHNAGIFNIGVPGSSVADLSVTSNFYSYPASATIVNGDIHFPGRYYNCGSLEAYGDIHTGGGSDFENNCSTYIHGDFHLNGDYTNDGIMYFKGNVNFIASAIFYNTGILIFDDLNLSNDQIVGQISKDRKPTLIIRNTATLTGGAAVIDHYFYNSSATPPPGGGFNSVCGTCTADIYIATEATVPTTPKDILKDCGMDIRVGPPSIRATLDFDGVDDYVSTPEFIVGRGELSIMAWVKLDALATSMIIAGEEDGAKLWLSNGKPRLSITTQGSSIRHAGGGVALPLNEWHHVAGTYSNVTGKLTVYVDGVITHVLSTGIIGNPIVTSASGLNTFEIGRLSKNVSDKQYFDGCIDEVRVFDSVLTQDQVQRMVYQEIQSNAGNVQGTVIGKDVVDITSNTKVKWDDILAYYPMTDIVSYERTVDYSLNNRHTTLHNITSVQEQTAPMPYESDTDGAWTTEGTWKHGDVWDIEDVTSNKDWSIVRINSNVTTTSSHTNLGLIIEDNQSLIVTTDKEINNSWYLELNGDLDLQDDAQLVQGINSDLVTGANGKVLRRQDGASNVYWYTYMSSPVGLTGVTTLTDNNAATNNTNNTAFQFNTLKEGDGSAVEFTNSYNEVGKISTRWMYTFQNGLTYYDWASYSPSTSLDPGVGYIHKGTGNAGLEQEYIFEGKPNNGTILIAADDVDGDSSNESQPDVTLTSILVGNPYPSAIDAHKFIDDNDGIIEGTLYLWQQWAGDNHVLREYEGGYATLNKMAKIKAYQFDGLSGAITTSQLGTKTPTRYLAVGQAFMTEVIADGNIEFNNGQRIFKKEATGETVFFRGAEATQDNKEKGEKEEIEIMHLDFTTSSGLKREIVLGFSSFTTEGYDYGYDAKMFETKTEDMFTMWKGHDMIAQAYPSIHPTNKIPLGLNVTGNHTYKIKATAFDNFKANQNVYLHDKLTNTYFDLRSKEAYGFTSERGRIEDRFEIVFKANQAKKDLETIIDNTVIYYNTTSDKLFVKGLEANAEQLTVVNMLGQAVMTQKEVSKEALNQGIHISDLSTGVYIVQITTADLQQIEKKIIID